MTGCSQEPRNDEMDELQLQERLSKIKRTIMVLSGKGGVGKSTTAVNIALSLAKRGFSVGLLDVDIHGPSIPKLLGLAGKKVGVVDDDIIPIDCYDNLKVISMGLLIADDDTPIIWRGPLKYTMIHDFLQRVRWGVLDYLIIDAPPGTGDEPLSIAQLIKERASAVIVTTPQQVATIDVAKCITFCNQLSLPIAGILENMGGFICPDCGKETHIFSSGGGSELATRFNVPFLGTIPIDPAIVMSGDAGEPYMLFYDKTQTAERFNTIVDKLLAAEPFVCAQEPACGACCGSCQTKADPAPEQIQ